MWIYEYQNWPHFTWNLERVANKLAEIRFAQGKLIGYMQNLGFDLTQEVYFHSMTSEILKSSAIEGECLNLDEVRSSIARRLGIHIGGWVPVSRHVEGIVDMMMDATQSCAKPLTEKRLLGWHMSLFPIGRSRVGDWRQVGDDPMQVISGPFGREKIHFEAPGAEQVAVEMQQFFEWFNQNNGQDPIVKAGIAHLWFLTIHPFEDGNGRIARAISDLCLARADGIPERFYSLSTQIESERKDYYFQLEKQQRSAPEITDWLCWFLDCLGRAIVRAESISNYTLYKSRFWKYCQTISLNERQRKMIHRMLDEDIQQMNTSKYAKMSKCSNDTALRDLMDLKHHGILIQNPGGGRSTSYRLRNATEV